MADDIGLDALATAAADLVVAGRRTVLGLAGAPGAGKTTLALALVEEVARRHGQDWVAHLPMDGFHLADRQLARLNALGRKGAPDTFDADGYAHLVERVAADTGAWVYAPGFERTLEQPIAAELVVPPAARLVVTEGNYLLLQGADAMSWQRARAAMTQVWYVAVDDDLRVERLVGRHVEFGKSPQDARSWVGRLDEANAALVSTSAGTADAWVSCTQEGWRFVSPGGAAS